MHSLWDSILSTTTFDSLNFMRTKDRQQFTRIWKQTPITVWHLNFCGRDASLVLYLMLCCCVNNKLKRIIEEPLYLQNQTKRRTKLNSNFTMQRNDRYCCYSFTRYWLLYKAWVGLEIFCVCDFEFGSLAIATIALYSAQLSSALLCSRILTAVIIHTCIHDMWTVSFVVPYVYSALGLSSIAFCHLLFRSFSLGLHFVLRLQLNVIHEVARW